MIKQNMTIFFVKNQEVATCFYQNLFEVEPILNVPGMTEFRQDTGFSLGLMPLTGIKKLIGEQYFQPSPGKTPPVELYLTVDDPEVYLERAIKNGAELILPVARRDWGDRAGYCMDIDDHVLAFAEPNINDGLRS
ncbi:MAG: glyoxalase [Candidatus Marinimicrobia bacterium]|nr:glyoxalase [Candidatus Neomarinimicrobiota bacterium]